MTTTLLDFSSRRELALHADIVADVEAAAAPLGISTLIVGAFARDLHLFYAHGIVPQRQTEDLDFALAVRDWTEFESLKQRLTSSTRFQASPSAAHRLRYRSGLPVDLVPFGAVETLDRKIAWPPSGDVVMSVFGFQEALAAAHEIVLPGDVRSRVVSLPALALLKLICWEERHTAFPRKDAQDLQLIVRSYLDAGNEARLWGEFLSWTQEDDFDSQQASARMLGHDVRALLDDAGVERVESLLLVQADPENPGRLPAEMDPEEPDRARALLGAMHRGLVRTK
jgi:predicted nucleotidyltransferase